MTPSVRVTFHDDSGGVLWSYRMPMDDYARWEVEDKPKVAAMLRRHLEIERERREWFGGVDAA